MLLLYKLYHVIVIQITMLLLYKLYHVIVIQIVPCYCYINFTILLLYKWYHVIVIQIVLCYCYTNCTMLLLYKLYHVIFKKNEFQSFSKFLFKCKPKFEPCTSESMHKKMKSNLHITKR